MSTRTLAGTSSPSVDPHLARRLVQEWDEQQQRYALHRDTRFEVVLDVLAGHPGPANPTVVDLGCGPGSLTARVARRLPSAHVIGLDADPLLLALGRAACPEVGRFTQVLIGAPGWPRTAGLTRPVDAVVSSTALHYLDPEALARLYRDLAALVRPGGLLVNADHLPSGDPALDAVHARLLPPAGDLPQRDWAQWWQDVESHPDMADLLALRRQGPTVSGDHAVPLAVHTALLRRAGFTSVGTAWQHGTSVVLVAVR
ncbi:class I SAM-dependent methyltransferase [Cellulomonas bogoriensis]|uniref:Methyltransferase n=1 Tax=Cellulomonas bogoriensis 69B4 = DSM 16987 TaxID=1386082 RepID=A0A0A0BKN8_9CELL|nr:class I SAM-dependent methyltransferase [Cellulomonas bogoriensis]KGM08420.1 methyltransferase [Cellulomonas bogoriensis 69B4 = DSM 16987]